MADYVSHMLAARDCLRRMGKTGNGEVARLFCLGAQGPDLLMYLAYTGLPGGMTLGNALHVVEPYELLQLAARSMAAGEPSKAAYLAGFALHLYVDNAVHPTINALAAQYADKTGMSIGAAHVCIESSYESRELLETVGLSIRRYPWRDDLVREDEPCKALLDGMEEVFHCAGKPIPPRDSIRRTMRRLPLLFSLLFDRTGAVLSLVRAVGLFQRPLSAALWHVKRPAEQYPPDALSEESFQTLGRLIEQGKEEFLSASQGVETEGSSSFS